MPAITTLAELLESQRNAERSITYHAFRDYVALARKELRSK